MSQALESDAAERKLCLEIKTTTVCFPWAGSEGPEEPRWEQAVTGCAAGL